MCEIIELMSRSKSLFHNSRFYILAAAILGSLLIVSYFRITIPSDQLYIIRVGQVYGLLAVLLWYLALILSPLSYVIGKARLTNLLFARRAIGVSAAYFALLHLLVTVFGQLGGISGVFGLPPIFKVSVLLGFLSFIILLIMAATSFDKVIRKMTYKRWKMLHRLGYLGGIAAVAHIWMVGTHIAYTQSKVLAFTLLTILAGLEAFRLAKNITEKSQEFKNGTYRVTIFISIWAIFIGCVLALPLIAKNYHGANHVSKTRQN